MCIKFSLCFKYNGFEYFFGNGIGNNNIGIKNIELSKIMKIVNKNYQLEFCFFDNIFY